MLAGLRSIGHRLWRKDIPAIGSYMLIILAHDYQLGCGFASQAFLFSHSIPVVESGSPRELLAPLMSGVLHSER